MVCLGSVFATDDSFYQSVNKVLKNGDDTLTLYTVTTALADLVAYDNSIASMTIVSEDGDIFQYNRESKLTSVHSNFRYGRDGTQLEDICK